MNVDAVEHGTRSCTSDRRNFSQPNNCMLFGESIQRVFVDAFRAENVVAVQASVSKTINEGKPTAKKISHRLTALLSQCPQKILCDELDELFVPWGELPGERCRLFAPPLLQKISIGFEESML